MSINQTSRNWILSSLGLLSIIFSVSMLYSTTVFASCSASMKCGEFTLSCNCSGAGSCSMGAHFVACACNGAHGIEVNQQNCSEEEE